MSATAQHTKCVYGTRDAGMIWKETYRQCPEDFGFIASRASPCCLHHPEWKCSLVVHGDDFTALGVDASIDKLELGSRRRSRSKCAEASASTYLSKR